MKTFRTINLLAALVLTTTAHAQNLEHTEKMWGLKNTGATINIDLDPLQAYRIQGRAGEDINLPAPVKGKKILVAVLDTGIDVVHPALKSKIHRKADKCEAYAQLLQCIDANPEGEGACRLQHLVSAENVYPADCVGWSVFTDADVIRKYVARGGINENQRDVNLTPNDIYGRPNFEDKAGHGTHVAGIIRSVSDNIELLNVQVEGVAPNKPLQPYSVDLAPNEKLRTQAPVSNIVSERVARGLIYAMNSGAQVINLSLGWPEIVNTESIKQAIAEAQRRGIIIVAAAGNDSTSAILRPCQYKGVICVAAHRPDGALAHFSNYGMGVDIAAPGIEILSTIPSTVGSVRLPGFRGYDFLSGTSQATPYVTGVIAEMLSRGIPVNEIYPRLILGARPLQAELPVLRGPINKPGVPVVTDKTYKKFVLSGNMDATRSLGVKAQTLILPADKETAVINWDRRSTSVQFKFNLKNYWSAAAAGSVQLQVRSKLGLKSEPKITAIQLDQAAKAWAQGEERAVTVQLSLADEKGALLKRFPSELVYQVDVFLGGQHHRLFETRAEVVTSFAKETQDADITNIGIEGEIPQGFEISPVTDIYDGRIADKDYVLLSDVDQDNSTFDVAFMRQEQGRYKVSQTQTINFESKSNIFRPRNKLRVDIDGDGRSEYLIVVYDYLNEELGIEGPYRNQIIIFNNDLTYRETVIFDDQRMALPFRFFWMKIGQDMRPAWVSKGPEIKKKWDITDLWGLEKLENVQTKRDIRLFYLDKSFKLAHVDIEEGLRIVDVVQPNAEQMQKGILTVLLARNEGTEVKPSYLNTFSIGYASEGKLTSQKSLNVMNSAANYRNLVDTFSDAIMGTSSTNTEFRGTMWYGLDSHSRQRVTILDVEDFKFYDKLLQSQRPVFDAALLVKSGYVSPDRAGVFVFTNSELEYHDLNTSQISTRSLNRYTFYGSNLFIENHYPLTLIDRQNPRLKHPAVFTTEGAGLSRTMKIMIPVYEGKDISKAIINPAGLNFKSSKGCRSLPTPLYMGENSGYALDYYCGDQIKRLLLKY